MKRWLVPVLASVLASLPALPATGDSAVPAVATSSSGRPYTAGRPQLTNPPPADALVSPVKETKAIGASPMSSTPSGTCSQMSLGDNASLNGFVPFPSTYAWNTDISSAPLDPNNAAITSAAGFAGLHLHHDFSSVAGGNYGIPYVVVDSSSTPLVPINVIDYADESDVALAPYPITAPIEGSPADCDGWPDTYVGDSHVLVLDRNACMLYETFNTHRCNGAWNASSETIWDLQSSGQRPWGWTSADAAGLAIFPGLVRYDEVAAGAINHAIRFTMQQTKNDANDGYFVEPASHAAGTVWGVSNVMGMRIRLKASFDISGYSPANQVILTAMKKYGMILADNGGYFFFQGVPDPRWDDDDLLNLDSIQSSNFEVVQMTPAFPGYDAVTAPTGQPPTINSFTASASTVAPGTPVTLSLNTSNDSYDFIDVLGGVHGGSVTTTPATTTTYTLNATNQYGRSTMQVTVNVRQTIVAPIISSLSPASAAPGGATFTLTVNGTNFVSGSTAVQWNGSSLTTAFVSATQVTASVTSAMIVSAGLATVTVTNAGGATSNGAAFPIVSGPTAVSVSLAGTGSSQTFTFTFSDPSGWQSLGVVDILINRFLNGSHACYIAFSSPSGMLYLVDDTGDAGGPFAGTMALPGTGSVSNSQCTVNGTGSSAVGSGTTLTLTLNIAFSSSFAGNKVIYTAARDTGTGNSGWLALGTWGAPGAVATVTEALGVSPASGSGASQIYTFTFSDSNGWQDLGVVDLLMNSFLNGRNACYIAYSAPSNTLYLVDDAGDAGGPFAGTLVLPGNGTISNSQCTINGTGSSAVGSGNTLTLTLNMSFAGSFVGNRILYTAARNGSGTANSGWQALGAWAVP